MSDLSPLWNRLGVIIALLEKTPARCLGRTAIMKLLYLLLALRGMRLEYDFSLYIYGPFDQDVIDDLSYAESLGVITSKLVSYTSGYGYEIRPGEKAEEVKQRASDFLATHENDFAWVIDRFGNLTASELEMIGTLLYVDRELEGRGPKVTLENLAKKVQEIKPHFGDAYVHSKAKSLLDAGLLRSVALEASENST